MYLKHLSISGFKSFAKKSELEFSAPITAIVGPNGSGKSNVAEAFRFVLGEQSLKSMRGKKGEDLIFNGSDSTSRGNRAQVSVMLDNNKRVFQMDFDEILVERTVHRDGQNEYAINGSKVRLKDVQELLAAANIGSTGHHIISQGEADRILTANNQERREMIEDALGLKVYQYKKNEAQKKLEKTKENVAQVQSLRREVAPHLQFLERQLKKIERALQLKQELTSVYAEYLKREDTYIAFHHDRLIAERNAPSQKLQELKSALIQAKEVLAHSHAEDTKSTALVNLEEQISDVRKKKQELFRKTGQLDGQVTFLERRIAQMKDANSRESEAVIPIKELSGVTRAIEDLVSKAVKSEDVGYLQRTLTDMVHMLRKFVQQSSGSVVIDTRSEEAELSQLNKERKQHEEETRKLEDTEIELTKQYEEVRRSIEAEQSESREAEREMFRIVGEQRECENALSRIDNELLVLERDRNEFKRELQEAVALIGSGASRYFSFEIIIDGKTLSNAQIVEEERQLQKERRRELEKLKIRLEELGGVDSDVEKEYKEVKGRDDFLVHEIADLEASITKLEELIAELTASLNEEFIAGIDKIGSEFSRFFTLMFGGGEAKLVRVKPKVKKTDESDEEGGGEDMAEEDEALVVEGIEIDVKLPNKRVRGLDMLSGGERALTSIALIFAMSQVNPPLFIILDETDAALDEANSRRYGDMIEALAQRSQLILITHNRETMSRAGILYGVTMGSDGVSKLLSVKFDEAVAVAK